MEKNSLKNMAKVTETTFKDLQQDERYKRLERTLKMVLLKKTENSNTVPSPSISSINGDYLDTSCTAMSVQSSRIGSEVVSSSANLRNIMSRKKQFFSCDNIALTNENQSSVKDNKDRVMMPPPKLPGPSYVHCKRPNPEIERIPLSNASINLNRNNFARSTPISDVSSIPKHSGSTDDNNTARFSEEGDYWLKNTYKDPNTENKTQERIFSEWRVLLNDKAQLIIKGTLQCGKIARSKPILKRLSATSVQSIFKHIYHLRGNLVDERNELPDYVRGKFYNGFPDDWENVYQVWRNFISDDNILSFRWPTPVTDSDDDIQSEITEFSYYKKFVNSGQSKSPRKRRNYSKSPSSNSSLVSNVENHLKKNQCVCLQSNDSMRISQETSIKSSENLVKNSAKSVHGDESFLENMTTKKNKSSHNTSIASLESNKKIIGNSLIDILQEDKLNAIIDNLTNKNCSMKYIQKIVEMFDCLKYIVSYETTEFGDTETIDYSKDVKNSSPSVTMKNRSTEKIKDRENHLQRSAINHSDDQLSKNANNEPNITEKLCKDRYTNDARRKLTKEDYDATESENDYYEKQKKSSEVPDSLERINKSYGYNDHKLSNLSAKTKHRYHVSERNLDKSRESGKFKESCIINKSNRNDSSLSDNEFKIKKRFKSQDSRDRVNSKITENPFRDIDPHDSSVSITEDENEKRYRKQEMFKNTIREKYDSSVSITEDERGDIRTDRRTIETLKHNPETNFRPSDPNLDKIDDFLDKQKSPVKYYHESDSRLPNIEENREKKPITNDQENNDRANDFLPNQWDNSIYESLNEKSQKISDPVCNFVEKNSKESCSNERLRENELKRNTETCPLTPAKLRIRQIKKTPIVVSSKIVNIDLRGYQRANMKNDNKNDVNTDNLIRTNIDRSESDKSFYEAKNVPLNQKIAANLVTEEHAKVRELDDARFTKKETRVDFNDRDNQMRKIEMHLESPKITNVAEKSIAAKFGSEDNPKKLISWVPAVISENDDSSSCHLIFEGKLLNEAGHVVNRKFSTDFVKRRLNPRLVETIDHVFYQLVGDLNDTKHVVPKNLLKVCRAGCPYHINSFCEKWKLSSENKTMTKQRSYNTSVDDPGISTSSRGRRILPPLNYWTGERIATKGNTALYTPGNSKESSTITLFEEHNDEITVNKISTKGHANRVVNGEPREKGTAESSAKEADKKDTKKISPSTDNKLSTKKSSHSQKSKRLRSNRRRSARNMHDSSSQSDGDKPGAKIGLRKRKMKNDSPINTDGTLKRKLKHSSKITNSSQSFERSTTSCSRSFEKPAGMEINLKLRKRQKIDQDQNTMAENSKRSATKGSSEVTCMFYKNIPSRDCDLSEDQLSTI